MFLRKLRVVKKLFQQLVKKSKYIPKKILPKNKTMAIEHCPNILLKDFPMKNTNIK